MRQAKNRIGRSAGTAGIALFAITLAGSAVAQAGVVHRRPRPPEKPREPTPYIERGDLPSIAARSTLRVIVDVRAKTDAAARAAVDRLARARGWKVQTVEADGPDEAMSLLRAGLGDVAVPGISVCASRRRRVSFTRAVGTDDEFVVARRGGPGPASPAELGRWEVHVRPGTPAEETLVHMQNTGGAGRLERVEEGDVDLLARDVAQGKRPLAAMEGRDLARLKASLPGLRPVFSIAHGRTVALAVRQGSPLLRAELDAAIGTRAAAAVAARAPTVLASGAR